MTVRAIKLFKLDLIHAGGAVKLNGPRKMLEME
jgi:hypothetical protein